MNDATPTPVALGWPVPDRPWMRSTVTARVDLGVRWRFSPSALRGATLEQIARVSGGNERMHSDWNGRLGGEEGETISRIPPILYRVRGDAAHLYLWGPRTAERLAELGAVDCVINPEGRVCPVELTMDTRTEEVGITPRAWHLYETTTPWWPPARPWGRRPQRTDPDAVWAAWCADALSIGILGFFRAMGATEITEGGASRLTVSVVSAHRTSVVWHRDEKGIHKEETGFLLRFVANCALPDGIMLGKHGAEGYGEIRRTGAVKIQKA